MRGNRRIGLAIGSGKVAATVICDKELLGSCRDQPGYKTGEIPVGSDCKKARLSASLTFRVCSM
jgi:hypothetical protein